MYSLHDSVANRVPDQSIGRLERNIVLVFLALGALAIVPGNGERVVFVAFFASIIAAGLRITRNSQIPIIAFFELGVALIVFGDGLFSLVDIEELQIGQIDAARRFFVLSFAMVELGYVALGIRIVRRQRQRNGRTCISVSIRQIHKSPYGFSVLLLVTVLVAAKMAPEALRRGEIGRVGLALEGRINGESRSLVDSFLDPLVSGTAIILPGLWMTWFGLRRWRSALFLGSPILALLFLSSTRYPLLAAGTGLILTLSDGRELRRLRIIAAGVVGVAVNWVMVTSRSHGILTSFSLESLSSNSVRILGSEGVLVTAARIMSYTETNGLEGGKSLFSALIFWIPRSFWPGKPTLLGYWFPREYGLKGFGSTHSISGSYGADALIDFGFVTGAVALTALGFAFAYFEFAFRQNNRHFQTYQALIGSCYGLAFFAARSLITAAISFVSAVIVTGILHRLVLVTRVVSPREEFTSSLNQTSRT